MAPLLRDLTGVSTVYAVKTIRLRIKTDFGVTKKLQVATKPIDAYTLLRPIFDSLDDDQEHVVILVMKVDLQVSGFKVVASGMTDRVHVDLGVVFRNALLLGASAIIVAHNHPTGSTAPSDEDLKLTRSLVAAGRTVNIAVHDHIILGNRGYRSLAQTHPELFDRTPTMRGKRKPKR